MKIVINNNGERIPATLEVVDGVMIVSPIEDKVDISQFKDGDVVFYHYGEDASTIAILQGEVDTISKYLFIEDYVSLDSVEGLLLDSNYTDAATDVRYATEEEKEKLFKAIKDNGYNWNSNTKTLEKLIVPKFDISLLKPFDKVLVRDENLLEDSDITDATWSAALYSHNKFGDNACPYVTTNGHFAQCVPYKGNEHLLGTTDDCDDYYKTWE